MGKSESGSGSDRLILSSQQLSPPSAHLHPLLRNLLSRCRVVVLGGAEGVRGGETLEPRRIESVLLHKTSIDLL